MASGIICHRYCGSPNQVACPTFRDTINEPQRTEHYRELIELLHYYGAKPQEELEQHRGYDILRYETPSMLMGTTLTPSGVLWA